MKKRELFLLSTLLFSSISLVACNDSNSTNSTNSINSTSSNKVSSSINLSSETYGEVKDYKIEVVAISGKKLKDVAVEIYRGSKLVKSLLSNNDGVVTFSLEDGNYNVELMNLPSGHYVDKDIKLVTGTQEYKFVIPSKVIEEGEPETNYALQDIMYDFTIPTSNGQTFNLKESLETHGAVMLNFWYTTCSWCLEEFPFMEEAYQEYKDDIEILAITNRDANAVIEAFRYEFELTFPMAYDSLGITSIFGVANYPTTIFIDRYGIISYAYEGSVSSKEEMCEIFDMFIGDDYVPITSLDKDETDKTIPNVSMPASSEIEKVVNGEGFNATYSMNENETVPAYSWPWLISEDGKSIYPGNTRVDGTAATIMTNITIPEGKVFAFDYFASSELSYDVLYVIIDNQIIHVISGVESEWKTCFAFVSEKTKNYEIALCYQKDYDGFAGEDLIYVNNLRYVEVSDINTPTYIYRDCSIDPYLSSSNYSKYNYNEYSDVYFNEEDGYYHVDSKDGPLLLADVLYATNWSNEATPFLLASNNLCKIDGKDYNDLITQYASYSSNGTNYATYKHTSVTRELYEALYDVASYYGDNENENEWLELCGYFDAYGTNEEYKDPIKGLATFNAYDAVLGDQNYATFTTPILPRGLKFKFVPETSGVYKINSYGDEETICWIMDENGEIVSESNSYARKFRYENVDSKNFEMYYYFEANQTYFINPAFYDYLYFGTLQFNIEYVGNEYSLFTICSPGYFTTSIDAMGNMTGDIISTGIDVIKGDDGYYHELRADGTVGSIIYADFIYSNVFNYSLTELAKLGAFNFSVDSEGNETSGEDYTNTILKYAARTIKDEGDLYGCAPVDDELKEILSLLMDKYTFTREEYPGVENHWLKLCYYHQYIGA